MRINPVTHSSFVQPIKSKEGIQNLNDNNKNKKGKQNKDSKKDANFSEIFKSKLNSNN